MNYLEICIDESASGIDAMEVLNNSEVKIALVLNKDCRLIGTISDGDIRRLILRGKSFKSNVCEIMNKDFSYLKQCSSQEDALKIMNEKKIDYIPILNNKGEVMKILSKNDFKKTTKKDNHVVIMAGGKGMRLRPFTESCPKPMINIGSKPMLEIILENCIENGFYNYFLSVNYLKEKIINYFNNGEKWDIRIDYLEEKSPLGTAGGLELIPKDINQPILILNGDILTKVNLNNILNFHLDNESDITLCVRQHNYKISFGVVETDGIELKSFHEKPQYSYLINAGIYIINPEILSLIKPNSYMDMPDLISKAKELKKRVLICPIHEYWIDVGIPEALDKATSEW